MYVCREEIRIQWCAVARFDADRHKCLHDCEPVSKGRRKGATT
jgi:hypothetical protein